MNIIKSFNNTIDYLETVLDDEIDNTLRLFEEQKIDGSSHDIKRYGRKDY